MNEPLGKQLRYRAARNLRRVAQRIYPKGTAGNTSIFSDIGLKELGPKARRALIIYTPAGIERYVRGQFDENDPFFNRHSIYWDSVEMVRQLNRHGYVVDYADSRAPFMGDWNRYAIVIDQWTNLPNAPVVSGQTKVHYATFIHWLNWNSADLERMRWFKERTGLSTTMNRLLPTILSDEYADFVTYFGTDYQANSFDPKPVKFQLNISAAYVPEYKPKNIAEVRKNFLWFGGGGFIHKGLDIAMEAFAKVPEAHLHIVGNLRGEPEFWKWAEPFLAKHPNLHTIEGWMDVASPEFGALAEKCIGVVYTPAACGGPGAVAQAIHWGLLPVVTKSGLVRAEIFGQIVKDPTEHNIINSTAEAVRNILSLSENDLRSQSKAVIDFAKENHTREASSRSFSALLDQIQKRN